MKNKLLLILAVAAAAIAAAAYGGGTANDVILPVATGTSSVRSYPAANSRTRRVPFVANSVMIATGTDIVLSSGSIPLGSISLLSGTGTPEAQYAAPPGSMYLRTDGTGGQYIKATGTGNTGWTAH